MIVAFGVSDTGMRLAHAGAAENCGRLPYLSLGSALRSRQGLRGPAPGRASRACCPARDRASRQSCGICSPLGGSAIPRPDPLGFPPVTLPRSALSSPPPLRAGPLQPQGERLRRAKPNEARRGTMQDANHHSTTKDLGGAAPLSPGAHQRATI